MSAIVLGKDYSLDCLRALGFQVYIVKNQEDMERVIVERAYKASIIVIESELVNDLKNSPLLSMMKRPPVLLIVPSLRNRETCRVKELYETLSRAVGIKLKESHER